MDRLGQHVQQPRFAATFRRSHHRQTRRVLPGGLQMRRRHPQRHRVQRFPRGQDHELRYLLPQFIQQRRGGSRRGIWFRPVSRLVRRSGEACGQPWSETNLDRHTLTVTGQLVQDGWDVKASEPKTDSGFRVVALDDDTSGVLERHRKQQKADRAEWGSAWVETGLLFTQEDGSWLHPGKVTDLFERLVAASGLPPIRLHDLRHGAATLMLAAGIDIKIVSDTLGHSDTRITRDIYQSVLPHVGKNAAEATAKLVPLQRKAEAEEASRKEEKARRKARRAKKAQARGKKKTKRKKPRE